ncbi:TPA: hypothetical protein IU027_002868 [Enterococcus faecalis]|uniref:hypothetical protein n=1 Tax=Enterococcus faecalis TaxID=1351 RepID=UPI00032EA188|nr:hypothetical protein [Enterococcus faecalis]EOJ29574.1 hypothetical protein UMU_00709 [Enterococcus faecalis EnGen0300]EOK50813.1 hypothetical protein Q97_02417 [Enterococcus faecalis EnGen0061]ETT98972.1 hypothetical protein P003_00659 [Enterococcus faecalis EnGen0403]ETU01846.1 hypothetical protein P005_02636 [Enterococcus faecalis EnGen0405]ETU02270.1 hypothetical protein P004_02187 [Enterococcus faecalis EnGen0404]
MAIEVIAKSVNNFSEESLRIEKLENGEYKIIAKREIIGLRSNTTDEIELIFTKNSMSALIGSLLAITGGFVDEIQN